DRHRILVRRTLVIAISQSGESTHPLMAVRHAREQGAKVLAICNVEGSPIPRESDGVLYTYAGPEVGVAATKTFLTQLTVCYLIGLYLAQNREPKSADKIDSVIAQLAAMPEKVEEVLGALDPVREAARYLADA